MQRFSMSRKGIHRCAGDDSHADSAYLALTIYGDLIFGHDELPPAVRPIVTKHVTNDQIEKVYSFVQAQVDSGPRPSGVP